MQLFIKIIPLRPGPPSPPGNPASSLALAASRLVGILHGCLKTRTRYDEAIAWGHRENIPQSDAAA